MQTNKRRSFFDNDDLDSTPNRIQAREIQEDTRKVDAFSEHHGSFQVVKRSAYRDRITPGIYSLRQDVVGKKHFVPVDMIVEDLIQLPDSISEQIIAEAKNFWSEETRNRFEQYGFLYKRGILMHGEPGTGKTATIISIMKEVVKLGGVVLFDVSPSLLKASLEEAREVQPELPVLVVYEEFENWIQDSDILSLLDGEMQLDNILYLATTNYLDHIPPRIRNRPSRFATVIEVGAPSEAAKKAYLEAKLIGEDKHLVDDYMSVTSGFTIDQIKDLIVSVQCLGMPLPEAVAKLTAMSS